MTQQKAKHLAEIAELFAGYLERLEIKTATIATKAEAEDKEIANSDSAPEENTVRGVDTAAEAKVVAEHVKAIAAKLIDAKVKAKAAAKAEGLATTLEERKAVTIITANAVREAQNATKIANADKIFAYSQIRNKTFCVIWKDLFSQFDDYDDFIAQQWIQSAKEILKETLNAAKPNTIFAKIVVQGIERVYDIFDSE